MALDSLALQLLGGLSHATTLFLMACGLTLIFGVTRIVNFAHGSFFMLGALFTAHAVTRWWPEAGDSAPAYALAMLGGALVAALLGALTEWGLLRRMRQAPELYQLVATFGLTLALHDAMRWAFGPDEVFAPRFPGLKGAVAFGEAYSRAGNCSPWPWGRWPGSACTCCSRARSGASASRPPRRTARCWTRSACRRAR